MGEIDVSIIRHLLSDALNHQITQFITAFSLAAWIHGKQVKEEIRNQVSGLINSIDSLSKALKEDISEQNTRIKYIEDNFAQLQCHRPDNCDVIEKFKSKIN